MAYTTAPDFPIRSIAWSLDRPSQSNVSAWTGCRINVTDPWHGKWTAHVELATQQDESTFRSLRSFFVRCKGSLNTFRLYATAGAQNANSGVTVNTTTAAGATSVSLLNAAAPLKDGQYFTVNGQLCCCTADQSGTTVTFEPPLRQTANDGTPVVTSRPYALVYLTDSKFSYSIEQWRLFGVGFDVEEGILESDGIVPEQGANGIFFDTGTGSLFTSMSYPTDATLTIGGTSVAFNSSTLKAFDFKVKRGDGSVIDWAFDNFTVDATFTVNSFYNPDNVAAWIGTLNDIFSLYAAELHSHPGSATTILNRIDNTGSALTTDSIGYAFSSGASVRVQYTKSGDTITVTSSFPSTADHVMTLTQVFTASSYEWPRMFSAPVVRFGQGNVTLTALKVSAAYPNAKFAFVGDSLTQGRIASDAAHGFAELIRADYPSLVLIAGAPSANIGDWSTNIKDVIAMAPKYAFVMLGTNDDSNAIALATRETNYTALINSIIAAGIIPIALACPPKGSTNIPTFNTWLAAQGWRFVDTYTPLLGTGTSMNATYDSGDGIHPNTAGHAVIHTTIANYITAQSL